MDDNASNTGSTFENMAVGIAHRDINGRFLLVNEKFCSIVGYTREELLEKTFRDITYAPDLAVEINFYTPLLRGESSSYSLEKRYVRKDGSLGWVELTVSLQRDAASRSAYTISIVQDISERKRAEEALRRANERLDLAMRGSNIGIWEVEMPDGILEHGRLTHLNLWEQLGYDTPPPMTDIPDPQSVHPDDLERVRHAAQAYLSGEASEFAVENRSRHKDGSYRWVLNRGVVVRDAAGKPLRFSGTLQDITERKQAEEALRQAHDEMEKRVRARTADLARANEALSAEVQERRLAEEARTDLLRRLATAQEAERCRISRELHDQVGQQLTSLTLGLKSLRDGVPDPLPNRRLLERLQKTAEEVGRAVHELALRLRPTSLDDLGLHAALQSGVEEWARRAGVEVDFHSAGLEEQRLPHEVETVLYRVVLEALHNTLKHAAARHVSVLLERRNSHAVAIVEDDGTGFDADGMLTRPPPGRLGLLGMRERMALVGGSLAVESTPGSGTTVFARVRLLAER